MLMSFIDNEWDICGMLMFAPEILPLPAWNSSVYVVSLYGGPRPLSAITSWASVELLLLFQGHVYLFLPN